MKASDGGWNIKHKELFGCFDEIFISILFAIVKQFTAWMVLFLLSLCNPVSMLPCFNKWFNFFESLKFHVVCIQCFDAVGWAAGRAGTRPVKNEWWWGACMVICLEWDADLHMAQLMPLPLLSLASVKFRLILSFWYQLTRALPDKEPLNRCVWHFTLQHCSIVWWPVLVADWKHHAPAIIEPTPNTLSVTLIIDGGSNERVMLSQWSSSWLCDCQLSLCNEPLRELCNPGASGSIFYITDDDDFIIKTVQHKEAEFLQKLLPGYYMVSERMALCCCVLMCICL